MFDKKKYLKQYYRENKKRIKKQSKHWSHKNKKKRKKYMRQWNKEWKKKNLDSWEKYIPKETNCQICSKKIFFNQNNRVNAIHFDHKDENALIKRPTLWLSTYPCTPENRKKWKFCAFGMLCKNCNSFFPAKGREQFIKNVVKYALKGYKLCKI